MEGVEGKPFAGYSDFQNCINKNRDKKDPKAYCATIMRNVEGKDRKFVFYSEPFRWVEIKSDKGSNFFVEGYISTGDLDLVNDIVSPKCMESMGKQMKERVIKVDLEHETLVGDTRIEAETAKTKNPIAKFVDFSVSDNGVFAKAEMNQHNPRFHEIWGSIKGGFLDAFSIAYIPTVAKRIKSGDRTIRILDDLTLLNVAFTGNAINPNAKMGPVMAKSLEHLSTQEHNINGDSQSSIDNSIKEGKKSMPEDSKTETQLKNELAEVKGQLTEKIDSIDKRLNELEKKSEMAEVAEKKAVEEKAKRLEKLEADMKSVMEEINRPEYKAMHENMKEALKRMDTEQKGESQSVLGLVK